MRNAEKKMTELNLEERPMCYARLQPKMEGRNVALRQCYEGLSSGNLSLDAI